MRYVVSGFTIDTVRFRISAGDVPVPVEPKVFDLLVHLIRHRDRVLSRDELFASVWDGREVSDATLSNHVKRARQVLGDNGELQQTILTVRGRGYQFVAPVRELPGPVPAGPEGPPVAASADGPTESGPSATGSLPGARPDPAPAATPDPALAAMAPSAPAVAREPAAVATDRRRPGAARALPLSLLLLVAAALLGWRWLQPASGAPERPYVLVLPFDVAGGAATAWGPYADQATRDVIGHLRKIAGLQVVPTPSAFAFQGRKARDHIRAQLPDVRFVLDGEVSVAGPNRLRVAVVLEDLRSGQLLWSQDLPVRTDEAGSLAVQAAIARGVSGALRVAIPADVGRSLDELPTSNLRAYERYVAGRHALGQMTHESVRQAIAHFDAAIALDPGFFAAFVARSDAQRQLFAVFEPPAQMLQTVVDSLAEAQQLQPESAEVWSSLGLTYVMAWRWKDAWTALQAAKRRDPTLAQTELGFALYYSAIGEAAKARRALETANRLDPLNPELADWGQWALFMAGEHEAARAWGEQKMRQHPDVGLLFSGAGVGAFLAGDPARGVALAEQGARLDRSPFALILLAQAYGVAGQADKVRPLLAEAEAVGTYTCPYESAAAWITVGERERALSLLEDAVAKRSNCLMFLRNDPRLRPLHGDPRFAALLARVGLDDVALRSYKR